MNFAENLKCIIIDRNLKQADLCRMTGIQTSLMSDYLGGKKSPTIGNAIIISDALEISLDCLVGKDTYPDVSNMQTQIIKKIQKMSDGEIRAVLAFVNTLESINVERGE